MSERVASLTKRQRECLRGKWDRKLDKAIAVELGISQRAVEEHLRAARERLGVGSSVEAAQIVAFASGWAHTVQPHCGVSELPDPPLLAPYAPSNRDGMEQDAGVIRDATWNPGIRTNRRLGYPLRKKGERRNDLSPAARLSWIIIIASGIPAAMVLLFASIDNLGRLVSDIARMAN